jgi:hypothetical protein
MITKLTKLDYHEFQNNCNILSRFLIQAHKGVLADGRRTSGSTADFRESFPILKSAAMSRKYRMLSLVFSGRASRFVSESLGSAFPPLFGGNLWTKSRRPIEVFVFKLTAFSYPGQFLFVGTALKI